MGSSKSTKFRPRMLAMLGELLRHPRIELVRVEVNPPVHLASVKSAAKRAQRVLHPQVASIMAELPRFCVEWYAELEHGEVSGAISLLHEYDPAQVARYFGHTTESAPPQMQRGGLLDYGRSDDTDGALLLWEDGVLGPHVAAVWETVVDREGPHVTHYLEKILTRRGAHADVTDGALEELFGAQTG